MREGERAGERDKKKKGNEIELGFSFLAFGG